jgi:iron complex transport system ATP-binding protein
MKLLRTLADDTGKSILFSTHDLDMAINNSDRLWLLKKGGALMTGSPSELMTGDAFEDTFISGTDIADQKNVSDYFLDLKKRKSGD